MIDLHLHTTASDGQYSPRKVVEMAKASGLASISITDHDTVAGLNEAIAAAEEVGVELISGIEISAKGNRELHILGYGIEVGDEELSRLCAGFMENREARIEKIYSFLQGRGITLPSGSAESFAGGSPAARPHFAQAMVAHGFAADVRSAFSQHLGTADFDGVERPKCSPAEGISAIRRAGGVAVLAHPALLKLEEEALRALISELCSNGLSGLECHYSRHSPQQTELYLQIAAEYGLLTAAGSDFHGEKIKPSITMGAPVDEKTGQEILANLKAAIAG